MKKCMICGKKISDFSDVCPFCHFDERTHQSQNSTELQSHPQSCPAASSVCKTNRNWGLSALKISLSVQVGLLVLLFLLAVLQASGEIAGAWFGLFVLSYVAVFLSSIACVILAKKTADHRGQKIGTVFVALCSAALLAVLILFVYANTV